MSSRLRPVTVDSLWPDRDWGAVVTAASASDLTKWAAEHAGQISQLVDQKGALLFRGFASPAPAELETFAHVVTGETPAFYREAATPRSHVQGHVFTSTEYPNDFRIYLHNENSHVTRWPRYLVFHCHQPADRGGATPLADCRAIHRRLPARIVERFTAEGWLYRRNFFSRSAIPWQKAFGLESPVALGRYCRENFLNLDWTPDGIAIRYRRWAALPHPVSGDPIWFNHGMFFNAFTLEPLLREAMEGLTDEELASNTYHGDGTSIDFETLRQIDEAYRAETRQFEWRGGDVLLVDNMRLAHGREAYTGNRRVLVTMRGDLSYAAFPEAIRFCQSF